jgi:FkbM family methyltransferase
VLPRYPAAGGFTVVFADGSRVELDYADALGRVVLVCGRFEHAERDWLARRAAGGVAIDVGANVGWHTTAMAAAGARVIAVEPLAANLARLRRTVAGHPAVVVEATALGPCPGRVRHTAPADGAYAAVCEAEPGAAPDCCAGAASTWPMTTLDDLWDRHGAPPVQVVKIDVEGYELQVLRGGRRLLGTARPALLVETLQPAPPATLLADLGYRELPRPAGFEPWNHIFAAVRSAG